jgi:hypothetical protein
MKCAGQVPSVWKKKDACRQFVGNPEERRPYGHSWKDNVKKDLRVFWYKDVDWIKLAQSMVQLSVVVDTVMSNWILDNARNILICYYSCFLETNNYTVIRI